MALDTVETPFGRVENALGGTAVYYSVAASLFTDVCLVGVVGKDFPAEAVELLQSRGVDLTGLQRVPGETFRWVGEYDFDRNVAHTLDTRRNVFETFHPTLPQHYRDVKYVFLGNIDPKLQLDVLNQVREPRLTALDTMNFWIERKRDDLTEVLRLVDAVLINEAEIREYTGRYNVLEAARELQKLGEFDLKTSSWIKTTADIRKLGGAIVCDRRYNTVFTSHNGAESYYAARGFRACLQV